MANAPTDRGGLRRWAWLLPALLAAAAYAPAPWADFVWDDHIVVDRQLPAFGSWLDAFRPPPGLEQWSGAYYRPVVVLSYLLDRALFGDGSAGPHVTNVLAHVGVTIAVFALLCRLLAGRAGGALAGACLFAVHPVHTESVSWMSGRSDVLAALFLVPAVALALRWRDARSPAALAACAATLALALLSKEVALAAWALVPAALLLAPAPGGATAPRSWPALAGAGLALAAATVAWLVLRRWGMPGAVLGASPDGGVADLGLAARALAFLTVKSLWPWPQAHFVPATLLPGAGATAACLVLLAALVAGAVALLRRAGDGIPLLAAAWFLAAAAPSLAAAVLAVAEAPVAERYLYVPSVAVAMLAGVATCAAVARGHGRAAALAAAAVVVAGVVATLQRGLAWQDDVALWSDAVAKAPGEALPLAALATARDARGDTDGALALWQEARALARDPQLAGTIEANIGLAHLRRGAVADARRHLEEAVRLHEWQHDAQRGLGAALFTQAVAIRAGPGSAPEIRALLEAARVHYEVALRIDPRSTSARLEVALVLARLGDLSARFGGGAPPAALYREALARLEEEFARNPPARDVPAVRALAADLAAAVARGGGTLR